MKTAATTLTHQLLARVHGPTTGTYRSSKCLLPLVRHLSSCLGLDIFKLISPPPPRPCYPAFTDRTGVLLSSYRTTKLITLPIMICRVTSPPPCRFCRPLVSSAGIRWSIGRLGDRFLGIVARRAVPARTQGLRLHLVDPRRWSAQVSPSRS